MDNKILEVFGQYAAEIEGEVKMFNTYELAKEALEAFEARAEVFERASKFCDAYDITGKNKKGKVNIIVSFLDWEADGSKSFEELNVEEEDNTPVEAEAY